MCLLYGFLRSAAPGFSRQRKQPTVRPPQSMRRQAIMMMNMTPTRMNGVSPFRYCLIDWNFCVSTKKLKVSRTEFFTSFSGAVLLRMLFWRFARMAGVSWLSTWPRAFDKAAPIPLLRALEVCRSGSTKVVQNVHLWWRFVPGWLLAGSAIMSLKSIRVAEARSTASLIGWVRSKTPMISVIIAEPSSNLPSRSWKICSSGNMPMKRVSLFVLPCSVLSSSWAEVHAKLSKPSTAALKPVVAETPATKMPNAKHPMMTATITFTIKCVLRSAAQMRQHLQNFLAGQAVQQQMNQAMTSSSATTTGPAAKISSAPYFSAAFADSSSCELDSSKTCSIVFSPPMPLNSRSRDASRSGTVPFQPPVQYSVTAVLARAAVSQSFSTM
mmetsp:Transcript_37074/g.95746  ORF Transcript_37074/g.95746 Transcript_37074/m.95746 type:complete len:383 (-) Transcript_37074:200-1348(-)